MKTNRFKSYALNTLLTIALCMAYAFLGGGVSLVLGMLVSALLGVVFYGEHYGLGAANSLLILIIFSIFMGVLPALSNGIPLILLALALALGTRAKLGLYPMLLICAVLFMADMMVSMELLERMTEGEYTFNSLMLESGNMIAEMMSRQYQDTEMALMVEDAVRMAVDVSIMLAPAMMMIINTVLAYILLVIYKKMQQKQEVDMAFLCPFDKMQGDKLMAFLYLVLLLLISVLPVGIAADAAANVFLVLSFLFVMLGASVFDYKMKQKGMKKGMRRVMIGALIVFSSTIFFMPLLAFLICGVTDSFWDYRHLRVKEEQ